MTPGSREAIDSGCICPVMDNARGRGYAVDDTGESVFVVTFDCPVHDVFEDRGTP